MIFRHSSAICSLVAEHMRVILREGAHPHQPMQRARQQLVTVHDAELEAHAQRPASRYERKPCLKIWMWPGQFIGLMAKMRGSLVSSPADCAMNMFSRNQPQWPDVSPSDLSSSLRRVHFPIVAPQAAAHVWLTISCRQMVQPMGMPEHGAGAFLLEVEQVHLAPEFCDDRALLGLFELVQVRVELLLLGECGAVDPRQHRIACCRRANRRRRPSGAQALPITCRPMSYAARSLRRSNQSPWR